MKRTAAKDARRNVKKKKVSWFSIVIVTMMAVGVFLGMSAYRKSLCDTATEFYKKYNFRDVQLTASKGISQKEIDELEKLDVIKDIEGYFEVSAMHIFDNGKKNPISIVLLTEKVNVPKLTSGSLPEKENEIAISENYAKSKKLKIGDTIEIYDKTEVIKNKKFVITGIVIHPDFTATRHSDFAVAPECAFDKSKTNSYYSQAVIRLEYPDSLNILSAEYEKLVDKDTEIINDALASIAPDHDVEIKSSAQGQIDEKKADADKQIADAEKKIEDGQKEYDDKIADANKQISDAEKKIEDGQKEYDAKVADADSQIKAAEAKKDEAERTIPVLEKELSDAEEAYAEARKEADAKIAEIEAMIEAAKNKKDDDSGTEETDVIWGVIINMDGAGEYIPEVDFVIPEITIDPDKLDEAETELNKLKADYAEKTKQADELIEKGKEMLDSAKQQLEDGKALLAKKKKEFEDAKKKGADKLADARTQLDEKKKEFEEKKKEGADKLTDARTQLDEKKAEAEEKIKEAEDKVESLTPSSYLLMNRKDNHGYVDLYSMDSSMKSASLAFIAMFIIVGTLVCFSTIAIIIDEQKNLVGTMKSLGFFNGVIRSKYTYFGVSAVVIGILTGVGLSYALQFIMVKGLSGLNVFPDPALLLMPIYLVIISIAEIIVALAATFFACKGLLKQSAVTLMSGQSKLKRVAGKNRKNNENTEIKKSKKGTLYSKLIFRNMKTEIERVFISIIIISGSCAMIGIGFSMKFAFSDMLDIQLKEIEKYDLSVSYDSDDKKYDELKEVVESSGAEYIDFNMTYTVFKSKMRQEFAQLIVSDSDDFSDYYELTDHLDDNVQLKIPEDGVLIQSKMYDYDGLDTGDKITLYDNDLCTHEVDIKGVFLNRLGRVVIMSPKTYKELYGKDVTNNTLYINLKGADSNELRKKIMEIMPEASITTPKNREDNYNSFKLVYDLIVVIATFLALVMSIFVLSNLTNIFVNRRKEEVIVMRVNGFSTKQAIGYLRKETIATLVIGLALAVLYGTPLSSMIINMLDQPDTLLVREFNIYAWLIAIVFESIFAACINKFAFRKVKKLKVTDINS